MDTAKFNKEVILPPDVNYADNLAPFQGMFRNSAFNRNITVPSTYPNVATQMMFGMTSSQGEYYSHFGSVITDEVMTHNYFCETKSQTVLRYSGVVIYGDDCYMAGNIAGNNGDIALYGLYPSVNTVGATIVFKQYNNATIQVQEKYSGVYTWECVDRGSLPVTSGYNPTWG